MAVVAFERVGTTMPFAPSLGLALGKGGNYQNFVQVNGSLMDGSTAFGTISVYERGDANGDTFINFADMSRIRTMMNDGDYSVFADCNYDSFINFNLSG